MIQCVCVDSSDETDLVYDFVRPRQRRKVFAVKGHKGKGRPPVVRPGKAKDKAIHLFIVGVDVVKNRIFSRLRIKPPESGQQPKPGYMHFCTEQENGADAAYLRQFGNEIAVPRKLPNGEIVHVYKKKGPNEAVDLEVYAFTALHILGDAVRLNLGALAERLANAARPMTPAPTGAGAPPAPAGPGRRVISSGPAW
jgi:phage terminase large subunit GpA-like protein